MSKKKILIISIIVLSLIGLCGIVVAENLEDLQNKKNDLQNQINESNEQIEEIKIELTENLEQLNNINEKIYNYETEIITLETDLNTIEEETKKISEKLNIVETNYNLQKEAFQARMVAIYEVGDVVYLDVLLNSNSFSDFISNYYLIGEIAKYDNDLLENIEQQKDQIENTKSILEEKKENLQQLKKNKEKTTIALENSKVIRNSYISKLSEQEKETQDKINEYQTELDNLESQIVALTTGNIGSDYVGGEFAWPAPGYTTITSRYGMRIHPILKTARVHTGTDIAMPTGSYIIAANDGVVIKSMYVTGYGNMVMIDHGGGVSTLYGHASELIAQTGQEVKKGDIIMKAGSTGWSTGPHLHFEVRINGTAVDSLPYITKQTTEQENGGEE
jgi:murein DD-endopeptidase MepM/ murein hydrolase activator NlpD